MKNAKGILDKRIPVYLSAVIILGIWGLSLLGWVAVGYRFYWPRYKGPNRAALDIARWQKAVIEDPTDVASWVQLGYSFYIDGKYAEAEEAYRQAQKLDPLAVEVSYFLGLVKMKTGNLKEAEDLFTRGSLREPLNPLPHYGLAEVYFEQGKYDLALEKLNHILEEIDPTLSDVLNLRGKAYLKKGQREKAIASFKDALRFDPGYEESRRALHDLGIDDSELPPLPAGSKAVPAEGSVR